MLFWRQQSLLLTVICMVASLNVMASTTTRYITIQDTGPNPNNPVTIPPFSQGEGNLYEILPAVNGYPTVRASTGYILQGGDFYVKRLPIAAQGNNLVLYGSNQGHNNITLTEFAQITSNTGSTTAGVILINSGTIDLQGGSSITGSILFDLYSSAPIILNASGSASTGLNGDIVNFYNIGAANFTLNMESPNIIGNLGTTNPLTSATISMPGSGSIIGNVYTSGATNITNSSSGNISGNITAGTATIALSGAGIITGNVNVGTTAGITLSNSGGITGNLTAGGAATISLTGTGNINGSMTLGSGSTLAVSGSKATGGSISGLSTLSVTGASTTYTLNHNVSVATSVTVAGNTALVLNAGMSGAAAVNNSGTIGLNGSLTTGAVTNNGLMVMGGNTPSFSSAITGTGNIYVGNSDVGGSFALNSGSSIGSSQTLTVFNGSTMYVNGTATVGTAISGNSSSGSRNLIFGNSTAVAFTTAAAISNIQNITISSGTVGFSNAVTGVNYFNNSGTATITAAFTGSSGTILNSGIINLNTSNSLTGFTTINLASGSALNIPVSYSLSGVTITGSTPTARTGSVNISSSATVTSNSPIRYLNSINLTGTSSLITTSSISNIDTVSLGTGTTLELSGQAAVSNFSNLVINGDFQIDSGASFTLSANQNITGAGTGRIENYGQLSLDGSNLVFPGSFVNYNTGTFTINGQPNLSFTGTTTFTNQGTIKASFSTTNSLPQITTSATSPNLSTGSLNIGYNNNYIAGGSYLFISAPNSTTPISPGVSELPQPSFYISSWGLTSTNNSVSVQVVRDGFDKHALTPSAVEVGAYLEQLGSTSHDPSILNLLNALEKITNDAQLTAALDSLLPPQYTMLVTLEMLDYTLGAIDVRLASLRNGYSSGDVIIEDKNSAWIRAFSTHGKQSADGTLEAYTDKNHGWVFGIDRVLNNNLTLGVGGSISKTFVEETASPSSTTNISNYEVIFYGTLRSANDTYVDALICGGISNYHGIRSIMFPGYQAAAASNYSSQQLTLKAMASKIFTFQNFWQFTPQAMAQYSFIRQLSYTETGAGPYSTYNNPDNINLFRLGAGADLGIPYTTRGIVSIPNVYAMFYVDAKGGADTTNTQFVTGGPFLTNSVQASRIMLKFGAKYDLKFNQNFEIVANYDYVVRRGFQGHEAFLNLRYIF